MLKKLILFITLLSVMTAVPHTAFGQDDAVSAATPDDAVKEFTSIRYLLDAGYCDSAAALILSIIEADPSRTELLSLEVTCGILGSDPDGYIAAVLSDESPDLLPRYRRFLMLYKLGRHRDAWEYGLKLEKDYPEECFVKYWLGRTAGDLRMDSVALEYYQLVQADERCRAIGMSGEAYLRRDLGQTEQALELFKQVADFPEEFEYALGAVAWTTGYLGDWNKAIDMLNGAKDTLDTPRIYDVLGGIYGHLGHYAKAIEILEQGHQRWPKSHDIVSRLSWVYNFVGLQDAALELIKDYHPAHLAYKGIGERVNAATDAGDTPDLQKACLELCSEYHDYAYPVRVYVSWLDDYQRGAEADSITEYYARHTSPYMETMVRTARASAETSDEALRLADSILPNYQRLDWLQSNRLGWMFDIGMTEEAYALAEARRKARPGEISLLGDMAQEEFDLNHFDEALRWLAAIDSLSPGTHTANELRARILIEQGKLGEAAKILDQLSAEYPYAYYPLYLYRFVFEGDENKDTLTAIARRYLDGKVHSTDMVEQLAKVFSDVGDFTTADSLLTAAIAKNPDAANLYYSRGWVYNDAGDQKSARADFLKANELDPVDEYYRRALFGANVEAVDLTSFSGKIPPDTTGLNRFSVDSVLALNDNNRATPGWYGGVVLFDKLQKIIVSEYRSLRRYHRIVKLATAEAVESYGEASVYFNAWNETPHVLVARTIYPDGRVTDVKPEHIYLTSPDGSSTTDSRTVSISFPTLDSGVIIEYVVQLEKGWSDPKDFYLSVFASEYDPMNRWETELVAPASMPVSYEHSPDCVLKAYDSSGFSVYSCGMDNLPALIWEDDAPSSWEQTEFVRFGYTRTWKEVADNYWAKIKHKFESNEQITDLASQLTAGAATDEEKIDAIFRYVADSIRYVAVEFGDGSTIPRAASQVLDNRYGDCKDQMVLLVSLLNAVGVEAIPVLVTSYDSLSVSQVVPDDNFSHVVAMLPGPPEQYLDPTCHWCETYGLNVAYKGKPALALGTDRENPFFITPPPVADDDVYHRKVRMMPQPMGGVVIDVDITYGGNTGLWLIQKYEHADSADIRKLVDKQSNIGLWAKCKLQDYDIKDFSAPGKVYGWTARLTADSLFMKNYTYATANFWFYTIGTLMSQPDTLNRVLDFEEYTPIRIEDEFLIVPGNDWQLDSYRDSWVMDTTWFIGTSNVTQWEDSILVAVSFELKDRRIPAGELAPFVRTLDMFKKRVEGQSPYYRRRADQKRLDALTKAIADNPADVSLLVSLADLYLGADDGGYSCVGVENRARAREALAKALQINPDNETLIFRLGLLLMEDDLYADADSMLQSYIEFKQGQTSPYIDILLIGVYQSIGKKEEALGLLEKFMAQAPSEQLRVQLVSLYCQLGKHDDAKKQIELMETLNADSTLMMNAKFEYFFQTGDLDKARQVVANWPDTSKLITVSFNTRIHNEVEDWDQALRETMEMLPGYPDNPVFLNNCAWFMALSDTNLTQALEYADRCVQLTGGCDYGFINTRGLVYLKMGELELAKQDFEASLNAAQDIGSETINNYFLGEVALADGKKDDAIEYFQRAVELDGERWSCRQAKKRLAEL